MKESIAEAQAAQKALFNLLIGFMSLGLLVGIAALGVIGARAVVERRHGIGVLRAIGFSPGMVQLSFLAEMSFLAVVGIGLGLGLGLIALGAYIFSILITLLPARQAAKIAAAEALRYE